MNAPQSPAPTAMAVALRVIVLMALGFGVAHVIPVLGPSDGLRPPPQLPEHLANPGAGSTQGGTNPGLPTRERRPGDSSGAGVRVAPLPPALAAGMDIPGVAAAVLPSVVSITTSSQSYYGKQVGGGSGVILRADGIVVTNNHVIEGASEARAQLNDGRIFPCRLVGRDPASDLAVLQLVGVPEGELTPASFGDSEEVRLGESVLAVGNPFGLSGTVTMGIVSALGRGDVGIVDYEEFIQTDAAINPGNSGGALVNTRGELIGINTAILSRSGGSQGIGFAIPVHLVRPITESLIETGQVERGWLGIHIAPLTPQRGAAIGAPADARGVVVASLVRGGPADKSMVLPGDLIRKVEGREVGSPARLRNTIAHRRAGESVRLDLLRKGEALEVTVVLAPLPQERSPFYPRQGR